MNHHLSFSMALNRFGFFITVAMLVALQSNWAEQPLVNPLDRGYLFIDGHYVSPPYKIQSTNQSLIINDMKLKESYFDFSHFERGGRRRGIHRMSNASNGRVGNTFNPLDKIMNRLNALSLGEIIVLYERQPLLSLDRDNGGLRLLAALARPADSDISAPDHFTPTAQATWDRLITEFQPSKQFSARATSELQQVQEAVNEGERISAANQLVASISYPLTVVAMIAVVLAFGHLLSSRPAMNDPSDTDRTRRNVVVKSLSIIAVFSLLDLVWTLAASHSGTMRELNPLGRQFIDDPTLLIVFKMVVTGGSIAILYVLQRRPIAQIASWWCCLLLTLVTARWVVFQSLFA